MEAIDIGLQLSVRENILLSIEKFGKIAAMGDGSNEHLRAVHLDCLCLVS